MGDIQDSWTSLMSELESDVFLGPYINKSGESGEYSPHLAHTGLCLVVATAHKKIDVPILRHGTSLWWRADDYVVPFDGVGLSFSHIPGNGRTIDGHAMLRFFHVLGTIVGRRKTKPKEVFSLLDALEPLLENSGGASLKTNALSTLLPKYSKLGFATAPPKLQKTSLAVRIVWVYPKFRTPRAIANYLPVGTATFPLRPDYSFGTGRIEFPWYNETASGLRLLFSDEDLADPISAFTEAGKAELQLPIESRLSGGHQRTKLNNRRVEIIRKMKAAGYNAKAIVLKLREDGLYSSKVPISQQLYQVESLIRPLAQRQNDAD